MATVHKLPGRPFWCCALTIFDAETGESKRTFRSTKCLDKERAREICNTWHRAARLARKGQLNKQKVHELVAEAVPRVCEAADKRRIGSEFARKIIERGMSDIFEKGNLESLERQSIRQWCEGWLETQSVRTAKSTHERYARIIERFLEFIGKDKSKRDLHTLSDDDIERFHIREAKELSAATADLSLKVLRVCFGRAVKKKLLTTNPASNVEVIGGNGESSRRDFTLAEIKRILQACGDDVEWRGLILAGLYVGQRLGDLAKITWRAVNFETDEIVSLRPARKTNRPIILPLARPLRDHLLSLPSNDDPDACIFPNAAKAKRTGTLSNQFRHILVEAGLVAPRTHESTGKGRSAARQTSEISFHSLRHSMTSLLKATGTSEAIAMEIVGHDTKAMSRHYTNIPMDVMRAAIQRLPDVTSHE
jgi:integrase